MKEKIQNAARLLGTVGATKRWKKASAEEKKRFMRRVRAGRQHSNKKIPTFVQEGGV
jgi:hypothetical protein